METLLGRVSAPLDTIYYCPHHPDRGFLEEIPEYKAPCHCRKPGIEMIEQATEEFNIDLGKSCLVDNTTVDIDTARRAEIRSVLVETGYTGKDNRHPTQPTKTCRDLPQAAKHITKEKNIRDI